MKHTILRIAALAALSLVCAGCANGGGGQALAGVLSGIGAGLSGL